MTSTNYEARAKLRLVGMGIDPEQKYSRADIAALCTRAGFKLSQSTLNVYGSLGTGPAYEYGAGRRGSKAAVYVAWVCLAWIMERRAQSAARIFGVQDAVFAGEAA